jgi:hypothetical protein
MSEYLKIISGMIKGKNLFLIIGVLYVTLWVIDIYKAKEVLGGVVGIGDSIVQNILLIKNKISPKPVGKVPAPTLAQFLATPNQELLKMRNGLYNQPAGYYIEVNSDKGTCIAKYSKEHGGKWTTPAKILCPQIKVLGSKGSVPQK